MAADSTGDTAAPPPCRAPAKARPHRRAGGVRCGDGRRAPAHAARRPSAEAAKARPAGDSMWPRTAKAAYGEGGIRRRLMHDTHHRLTPIQAARLDGVRRRRQRTGTIADAVDAMSASVCQPGGVNGRSTLDVSSTVTVVPATSADQSRPSKRWLADTVSR
jgi:hypothetical protein